MQRANKPELVLLHGWGVNRCVWTGVAARLRARFRVSALDLPGYGGDSCAGHVPGDLAAMAARLLAVAPRPAIWLGWSLGGMVALKVAQSAPERVERLVLVGTTPRFVSGPDWEHGIDTDSVARFAADLAVDYERTLARFLLLQAGAGDQVRRVARALGRDIAQCGAPRAAVLQATLRTLVTADLRPDLPAIAVPARIIHGQHDRLAPVEAARYLARHLPAAALSVIPDAGHAPFLPDADAFVQVVAQDAGP